MSPIGALILAAATASAAPAPAPQQGGGVQLVTAQARAVIIEPVIVRQASGPETSRNGPAPQIKRRGREVFVEFE